MRFYLILAVLTEKEGDYQFQLLIRLVMISCFVVKFRQVTKKTQIGGWKEHFEVLNSIAADLNYTSIMERPMFSLRDMIMSK